jgi:hypothetical protein
MRLFIDRVAGLSAYIGPALVVESTSRPTQTGAALHRGHGLQRNLDTTRRWMKKVATQGDKEAGESLALKVKVVE